MNIILAKALKKFNLLKYLNTVVRVSYNKKTIKVPVLQEIGFTNLRPAEPWMSTLIKILDPMSKNTFIDVGVNVGQTLIKLKTIAPNVDYIGFEPNPICINYVDQLIKKNDFLNSYVVPIGISNTTQIGELNFFYSSVTDPSASIVEEFRPDQKVNRKQYIPLFSLEQINQKIQFNNISIIKIDVEGAELEVLESFKEIIIDHKPFILMEILPVYHNGNSFRKERQDKIQKILVDVDYSIFRLNKENEVLKSFSLINEIGIHSDINKSDYVMIPNEMKSIFLSRVKNILEK